MTSFQIFIIYFLLSGMLCHYGITRKLTATEEQVNKLSKERKEKYEEMKSMLELVTGNVESFIPFVQVMCLLFGWILLPYVILSRVLDKFTKNN